MNLSTNDGQMGRDEGLAELRNQSRSGCIGEKLNTEMYNGRNARANRLWMEISNAAGFSGTNLCKFLNISYSLFLRGVVLLGALYCV